MQLQARNDDEIGEWCGLAFLCVVIAAQRHTTRAPTSITVRLRLTQVRSWHGGIAVAIRCWSCRRSFRPLGLHLPKQISQVQSRCTTVHHMALHKFKGEQPSWQSAPRCRVTAPCQIMSSARFTACNTVPSTHLQSTVRPAGGAIWRTVKAPSHDSPCCWRTVNDPVGYFSVHTYCRLQNHAGMARQLSTIRPFHSLNYQSRSSLLRQLGFELGHLGVRGLERVQQPAHLLQSRATKQQQDEQTRRGIEEGTKRLTRCRSVARSTTSSGVATPCTRRDRSEAGTARPDLRAQSHNHSGLSAA